MLEIFIVWKLASAMGTLAAQKGLKKIGYQIMLIVLWIGGEITGALVGGLFFSGNVEWAVYIAALLGAAAGAGIAFLVMKLLPAEAVPSALTTFEYDQEPKAAFRKFGRSGWIPTLVILLVIFGLCASFSGLVLLQMVATAS